MVERALSMREVRGSMPRSSSFFFESHTKATSRVFFLSHPHTRNTYRVHHQEGVGQSKDKHIMSLKRVYVAEQSKVQRRHDSVSTLHVESTVLL